MAHPHTEQARMQKHEAAEAIGIDTAFISDLVETFYARIRDDAVLGSIFEQRITDWPHHLGRMKAFWGSILHQSGGFHGNPMIKHIAIPGIEQAEFERWLGLFSETLADIGASNEAADLVADRARMVANSLLTGIRIHRDGRTDPAAMKGLPDA